ncbi:hypothetical protein B0I00_1637 [Novosphingobium kunmingense]|uniref:Uncharacterized protein n=1 Tax=Novosphingobium kunmingense TaxID=1211806 RepID=A0A2N0HKK5_9SPHN|nr:hypothetical protein [Novosphingobium kunmingense]PKB19405.1 hypothetical protein B0I00_1637 [Novosphingobium kunmingense]
MVKPQKESFGVLVGWAHHTVGPKLDLTLQCTHSTRCADKRGVDDHHIVMTREQAAVLANYLFKVSGQSAPRQRGRLARWFA